MPVVHLKDISVPSGLVGWLLTDDRGRPRYWSTVWSALDGASLAPSTLRNQLSVIEQLYQSARRLYQADCLDCLIAELKFDELEACLETFFITARNHGAQTAANYHPNWRVAYAFVKSCVQRLVKSHADPDMLWLLSMRLERLEKLFDSLGIDHADYIFIDSWSIAAIPLRALQILGKETMFDALPAHPAKKMVDCKSVVCAPTPALKSAKNPLLLVSVVSSGSLVDKFQEIFNEAYSSKTLSTISVYSFSEQTYSLCVADYNIVNYNFEDCEFCKDGSKAIEIHPSAYYVKDPKDSGISLPPKIARMGYDFFRKYHAHLDDIVTFHKGDTSKGNKHYAYFLDYNQISKTTYFKESLQERLSQKLTLQSVILTLVDDPAIKLAAASIGVQCRYTQKPESMLEEATLEAIHKADKVVIYDSVTINGTAFTKFNNLCRQDPRLSSAIKDITFLVGLFRPTSSWKTHNQLRNSLAYNDPHVHRQFDYIECLVLPDVGPKECPWCLELAAIKGSLRPALKNSGNFFRRISKLSNLSDGIKGINAIFHIDATDETVKLGAESVLAPTDTEICGVILAVASALQQLRTIQDDKARLAPGFPHTQVLASTNFTSYSEGLIRSALIRNTAAIEFGVVEKEKTLEVLLKDMGDLDQGNMLSEYIIAVICGKLPSSSKLNCTVTAKLQRLISESPEVMRLAAI